VPENAVGGDGHLRHERLDRHLGPLGGEAAAGQRPDKVVGVGDAHAAPELAQFVQVGGIGRRLRRAQPHAEAGVLQSANALDRLDPRSRAAPGVVDLGPTAVEADLHRQVGVGHGAQPLQPDALQQHAVGQYGCSQARRGIGQHVVDVIQQERLAAGEVDVTEAQRHGLVHNASDDRQPQRATRRGGAGLGHAVGAAQIAVKVSIDPQLPTGQVAGSSSCGVAHECSSYRPTGRPAANHGPAPSAP